MWLLRITGKGWNSLRRLGRVYSCKREPDLLHGLHANHFDNLGGCQTESAAAWHAALIAIVIRQGIGTGRQLSQHFQVLLRDCPGSTLGPMVKKIEEVAFRIPHQKVISHRYPFIVKLL